MGKKLTKKVGSAKRKCFWASTRDLISTHSNNQLKTWFLSLGLTRWSNSQWFTNWTSNITISPNSTAYIHNYATMRLLSSFSKRRKKVKISKNSSNNAQVTKWLKLRLTKKNLMIGSRSEWIQNISTHSWCRQRFRKSLSVTNSSKNLWGSERVMEAALMEMAYRGTLGFVQKPYKQIRLTTRWLESCQVLRQTTEIKLWARPCNFNHLRISKRQQSLWEKA